MSKVSTYSRSPLSSPITASELLRHFGDETDDRIPSLLALGLTREEFMEAAAWASEESDVMGLERRRLSGKVAAAFEILTAREYDEDGD